MVVPVFDPTAAPPPATLPAASGSPGIYKLTYVLAVPGRAVVQDEVDFGKLVQAGDSLLEVRADVHHLRIDLDDGASFKQTAVVNVNAAHRLRDIELEIRADNFAQAASFGHDLVAPLLSRWAFLHDVAITTSAVQIIEATTQVHQWSQLMLGAVKAFSDTAGVSDLGHRILLSAYRPAERVPSDLKSIGQSNNAGLQESLKPHAGRKFTAVLDDIRPVLRNAIAHLDPDGTPIIQDRWEDLQKAEQALPGLRWIARQLLNSELQEH